MKNKNGLKEALRKEVEKCHSAIDRLKEENERLRRDKQEQKYDI